MSEVSRETSGLMERLVVGDQHALAELFSRYHRRLRNMVTVRLDRRLAGRIDADDVIQEAYLDAAERLEHYVNDHSGSFYVWVRMIVSQAMIDIHRRHLGAQMRDVNREVSIHVGQHYQAPSTSLALQLLGQLTSPSEIVIRNETVKAVEETINSMDDLDREVLILRHFEQLTNKEVSEVLRIQQKAASIRYVRAIKRLKSLLEDVPEFADDSSNRSLPGARGE